MFERARMRHQSGIRVDDDLEIEREDARGCNGNAARVPQSRRRRRRRLIVNRGRSANDARRAKISATRQCAMLAWRALEEALGRMRANQRFRLKAILTRPSPNELAAMRDDFSNSRLWHQFGAVADDEKMQRKAAPRQRAGSRKENRSVDRSSRIDRARSSRPCRYRDRNSWFLRSISRFASFHRETGACSDA